MVQTNTKDILPMAAAGAIGFKIFFGETIGNLPFPDDGMCMEAFDYIAQSKLPLGIHAENRQIMAYCTNKLKTEVKTMPGTGGFAPGYLRGRVRAPRSLLRRDLRHQASRFPHELQAGGLHGARCQGARLACLAETGPHYLLREPNHMDQVGSLLKMNPPVRTKDHADVLWQGLREGFVDMLATDHSPHTLDEKGSDLMGKLTKPAIWDASPASAALKPVSH